MKTTFKTCLVAIALLIGINTYAQDKPITFGVKAGVNLSNLSGDVEGLDAKIGFNVGVTADYALTSELYILTGLEFTTKGAKYKEEVSEGGVTFKYKETATPMYLQLPVHLGYKFAIAEDTKIVFHAGPYIAYGIGGKYKSKASLSGSIEGVDLDDILDELGLSLDDTDFFGKDAAKRFDFGLGLGAGAEFGKIGVGLGWDFGLTGIGRGDAKVRNQNAYLTLGYKF